MGYSETSHGDCHIYPSPSHCLSVYSEHAHKFADAAESKSDDVEHKLEYNEIHQEYLRLFESSIQGFIKKENSSISSFYSECRGILDGECTALFEEHENKWFVDALLAGISYQQFYGLMVAAARRQNAK